MNQHNWIELNDEQTLEWLNETKAADISDELLKLAKSVNYKTYRCTNCKHVVGYGPKVKLEDIKSKKECI